MFKTKVETMNLDQSRKSKTLIRKQIMDDIADINSELSGLRHILRMKQCLLRKTNQEIYRMSRASSYIEVIDGGKQPATDYLKGSTNVADRIAIANFTVIDGGRGKSA